MPHRSEMFTILCYKLHLHRRVILQNLLDYPFWGISFCNNLYFRFYGACNEALMRISLVRNGPVAVSFEVYDDFLNYQGGIYHHTAEKDNVNFKFNPWEITNHVGKGYFN